MKKWLLHQCANTLAFLMFPAILYGARTWPTRNTPWSAISASSPK